MQTFEEKTIEMAETYISQLDDKGELTIFEISMRQECMEIIEKWQNREARLSQYLIKLQMNREQCRLMSELPASTMQLSYNEGALDMYDSVINSLKSICNEA